MPKNNKIKLPPFVMTTIEFLYAPETDKLTDKAFIVWIYMRNKFDSRKPSLEFSLTPREMKNRMSKATFFRVIDELIEAKFIERVKSGGLFFIKSRYKFIGPHRYFYLDGKIIS